MHRFTSLFLVLSLLQMNFAIAQPPQVRFESAPQVGDLIPDITIVDDQGNPVKLRDITFGQYTVITLGCLT